MRWPDLLVEGEALDVDVTGQGEVVGENIARGASVRHVHLGGVKLLLGRKDAPQAGTQAREIT